LKFIELQQPPSLINRNVLGDLIRYRLYSCEYFVQYPVKSQLYWRRDDIASGLGNAIANRLYAVHDRQDALAVSMRSACRRRADKVQRALANEQIALCCPGLIFACKVGLEVAQECSKITFGQPKAVEINLGLADFCGQFCYLPCVGLLAGIADLRLDRGIGQPTGEDRAGRPDDSAGS
jgi:hypothetical protein